MKKVITAQEAAALIKDGDYVATEGFVGCAHPEELTYAIEERFLAEGAPKDLTLIYAAGQGDGGDKGNNHLGHEGLVKRVIGGHWNLVPKLGKLAMENKIEAYNLPQGVICHLFRDIAAKKPGTITTAGLRTFVDPRIEGGKLNSKTTEDIVELVNIDGAEYLRYRPFKVDVALIRGTYADEKGNVSLQGEVSKLAAASIARAAKACGGTVIVQVENLVKAGSLDPRLVEIPGICVDYVVVCSDKSRHMQTFAEQFNPSYCGDAKYPASGSAPMKFDERKLICRRCAMELKPNTVINLGIGMAEGVAKVANEEGFSDKLTLTVEAGPVGGVPQSGLNFGAAMNAEAILDQSSQFDFYLGGGIDYAFLGLAQCDKEGNINVSKFNGKVAGCGGFIEITQNAKQVCYCGTFTAGGLKVEVQDGKLVILNEGKVKKFVPSVEQVTFSGKRAIEIGQSVLYVTERAVFELSADGLVLTEIAPGIDLERDILAQMEFTPKISENLKTMDLSIFNPAVMGLAKNF